MSQARSQMASFASTPSRRSVLALLGSTALALSAGRARAGEELIGRLIAETRDVKPLSRRIDVISAALRGKHYRSYTLIGGPKKPELFVARDDVFDCVTYCETVLAAARAHDVPEFEGELRKIRYRNGALDWRERNHDFAAWCARNVENGVCRPLTIGTPVLVNKIMTVPATLGRRTYELAAIPQADLLAGKAELLDGDIIGFVSRRTSLDYYHCGFVMFGDKGALLLRHASQSRYRVVDEPMQNFLTANGVRYVTLLRPLDPAEKKA